MIDLQNYVPVFRMGLGKLICEQTLCSKIGLKPVSDSALHDESEKIS